MHRAYREADERMKYRFQATISFYHLVEASAIVIPQAPRLIVDDDDLR